MLEKLRKPITVLKGIGPAREQVLADQGIRTLKDILLCLPRRYRERPSPGPFKKMVDEGIGAAQGEVVRSIVSGRGRRRNLKVVVKSDDAIVELVLFNRGYLKGSFKKGRRLVFHGKITENKGVLQALSPDYHFDDDPGQGFPGLIPVYSLPDGLFPRTFNRFIDEILDQIEDKTESDWRITASLPDRALSDMAWALNEIHRPSSLEDAEKARRRIAYEEFFAFQLTLARLRQKRKEKSADSSNVSLTQPNLDKVYNSCLPFNLTSAQVRAKAEISEDLRSSAPMHRLLQGDVGSGKTAVALYPLLAGALSGGQSALMAPTEVLAAQHFEVMEDLLEGSGVKPVFLRAGTKAKEVKAVLSDKNTGVVIGTHALIQDRIEFRDLRVCVIDEQHKFGVRQRWNLKTKGSAPHVLVMTATPIPRSLALTLYGELDITILDESPPGRTPVKTAIIQSLDDNGLTAWLENEIETGGRAFFVCPLVNESEKVDLEAAVTLHKKITARYGDRLNTGLLHGAMPSAEKDRSLEAFRTGEVRFLVTTVVVEVGVDIPEASTMVILDAWRFGLAQLHQIRGRTGRGARQSRCYLVGKPTTDTGKKRIKVIKSTTNGFKIAEEDLKMRGPGEALGLRQHGLPTLVAGDYVADLDLMTAARDDARLVVSQNQPIPKDSSLFIYNPENTPWIG